MKLGGTFLYMFSYFKNGITDIIPLKVIDLPELVNIIKNNPDKDKIDKIRILKRSGDQEYKSLKNQLPNITPNCSVKKRALNGPLFGVNFIKGSGCIYLDIDNVPDINRFKLEFIKKYGHLVAMVCISAGGDGLTVLMKISNDINGKEQFNYIREQILNTIFKDEKIDPNSCGIGRSMFISSDPDVYFNDKNVIEIEQCNTDYNNGLNQSISYSNEYIILNETFCPAPIGEVLHKIQFKTEVEVYNPVLELKPVDYSEVRFSKTILDGNKHRVYTGIIHSLAYLNPGVDPYYIFSFLHYINENYAFPPMQNEKLVRLFNFVYSSIVNDIEYCYLNERTKYIHFNKMSGLSGKEKRIIANKVNGKRRRNITIEKIMAAKEVLVSLGVKVTQKKIAEISDLALSTVKRNWRRCAVDLDEIVESINSNDDPFIKEEQQLILPQDPLSHWGYTIPHRDLQQSEVFSQHLERIR